jgi:uncharacterized protein (DUF305 family)
MKKELLYGIVGFVIGALLSGVVVANQINKKANIEVAIAPTPSVSASEHNMNHSQISMDQMSMADMNNALQGKKGDEFDKTFIQAMISHHQGAIEMANAAKQSAKHEELQKMADDIISAQTSEIDMMNKWQKDWGYSN